VLAPGFYARQNIRTPVKVPSHPHRHPVDEPRFNRPARHMRAGAVHRAGALPQCRTAAASAEKQRIYQPQPGWPPISCACCWPTRLIGGDAFLYNGEAQWWLAAGFLDRLTRLSLLVGGGIALYFVALG